jgi:uncharacterized membrane protein YraQ (UPF0718 family)
MDPEIFFLSVSFLGWKLALWRLGSTFFLSLISGLITHFLVQRSWLGHQILRKQTTTSVRNIGRFLRDSWGKIRRRFEASAFLSVPKIALQKNGALCCTSACFSPQKYHVNGISKKKLDSGHENTMICGRSTKTFKQRLLNESWQATFMVAKFMILAFFLEALIKLYIPSDLIIALLGHKNPLSILTSALIGVPVYTNNLAALGMVGGLLSQGMSPAASLAFLIAGPTTTIPAMAAVWKLVSRRVFVLFVSFALIGAVIFGYLYSVANMVF